MPVTDQNNQIAALQQQMQQAQAQQMLMPLIQKLMAAKAQQQAPQMQPPAQGMQGQGLGAMLGGQAAMGQQQGPPTLGMGGGLPMQMPNPDPQGQPIQPPLPPDPTAMGQ